MEKTRPEKLFDTQKLILRQQRALMINDPDARFLERIAAETLNERIAVINRQFETVSDVFSSQDFLLKELGKLPNVNSVSQTCHAISTSQSSENLDYIASVLSGEAALPIEPASQNLIASLFSLHWSNDLPGLLAQIRRALVPDGLFMAAMPGDQTLTELRQCLIEAESETLDGISLRVDPFGEVRQFGSLLQRAGFALPVVDSDSFTVRYSSFKSLVKDLRSIGATSALAAPKAYATRSMMEKVEELYHARFSDPDGKIRATFEIAYMSGWKPHESQQKPLQPGSAQHLLKDVL
jgi:SAM-dependent methyltransferase